MSKNLLVIRITKDVKDMSISEIYAHSNHYNIKVEHKDVKSISEIQDVLSSGKRYDYIYFAGHGDENCFTDNDIFSTSWSEIGKVICSSNCLSEKAIIMLYCCKGGINTVAYQLFAECQNIEYVCGAKQNVSSIDLIIGFNVFIYNIERRNIDPVLSANKATEATDIRFECFDRLDAEANPLYFYNYCKDCIQPTKIVPFFENNTVLN